METIKIKLEQCSETAMQLENDVFNVIVDRPVTKGGGGAGLMGGQYLLTGIGGCFCSTFFAAAQTRGLEVEGLKAIVVASLSEDLPKRFTNINLEVSYESCSDPDLFQKLLPIAEKGCLSINTIKHGMGFKISQQQYSL